MCGSPLYMAPELLVLKSGDMYNALATDAWSCGAVLTAMLLDRPPFPATSLQELIQMSSSARGLKLPDDMPRDQKTLIRGLLTVDPSRRLTLPQVRAHPWFRSQLLAALVCGPPKSRSPPALSLVSLAVTRWSRFCVGAHA